jgi:hypothetical protein
LDVFLPGFELATVAAAILEKRKKMKFFFSPLWEVDGCHGCRVELAGRLREKLRARRVVIPMISAGFARVRG